MAIGIPLYIWARKEAVDLSNQDESVKIFTKTEIIIALFIVGLAILGIVLAALGVISVG